MVATRATLAGLRVSDAMMSSYRTVSPHDTLETVGQHILAGFQQDFPVVDAQRVVGVIIRADLLAAMANASRDATVATVMRRQFAVARPEEMLIDVLPRLQECRCNAMPVLVGDQLVGLISAENVGELMMIRAAHSQRGTIV
jgi:predicted transcriptional regulator